MRKCWGFCKNSTYSVGCNGATIYIYDKNGKELAKFKDFPYAYKAAFMPETNIIAVKSTSGYLGFYNLDTLSLIKKHTVTTIGAQDEGFAFSADGSRFYNIEKPVESTATQLSIYETSGFTKISTLFAEESLMALEYLEIDQETGKCYLSGFMRDTKTGVFDHGFTGIFDENKLEITDIRIPSIEDYKYLSAYKSWELDGFTEKALEWNYQLKKLDTILPTSIRMIHEQCSK